MNDLITLALVAIGALSFGYNLGRKHGDRKHWEALQEAKDDYRRFYKERLLEEQKSHAKELREWSGKFWENLETLEKLQAAVAEIKRRES